MTEDPTRLPPPDSALIAKKTVAQRVLLEDGVQSVSLRKGKDGGWRICVRIHRGVLAPADLPDAVDGYAIEIHEDGAITPYAASDCPKP